ncbi:hypothetical protein EDM55_28835 [Brevibacillus centrosporus]|nr:hypothetical protein EDM55_28835 [Brevibacillus centrosporus]
MCKGGIPFICHTLSTLESISRLRVGDAFFISAKAPLKSSRCQAFKSGEEVRRDTFRWRNDEDETKPITGGRKKERRER